MEDYYYGCLFCRSGTEESVAEKLNRDFDGIEAIAINKLRMRRYNGERHEEKAILLPGYIFFRTCDEDFPLHRLTQETDAYRLLKYGDSEWRLRGGDLAFAADMFERDGVVGFSKVYMENRRIVVKEGFLKGREAQIDKVNHRAQTARVTSLINGVHVSMWVGYDLIEDG